MKTITRHIIIVFWATFLCNGFLFAQVKTNKINKDIGIKNDQILRKGLNKRYLKLKSVQFDNDYVLFESDLYLAHLKNELKRLKAKKSKSKSSKTTSKSSKKSKYRMQKIGAQILDMEKNPEKHDYPGIYAGNGCGGNRISKDLCDKIRNAMRFETIEEDEVPRPCPDDTNPHCLPIDVKRSLKFIVVPKTVSNFKALFYDIKGNNVGKTGKPLLIHGDKNHVAYPINISSASGNVFVKIHNSGSNLKRNYRVPLSIF